MSSDGKDTLWRHAHVHQLTTSALQMQQPSCMNAEPQKGFLLQTAAKSGHLQVKGTRLPPALRNAMTSSGSHKPPPRLPKVCSRSRFCFTAVAVGTISLIIMSLKMSIRLAHPRANFFVTCTATMTINLLLSSPARSFALTAQSACILARKRKERKEI